MHLVLPVMSYRGVRAALRYCIFFVPVIAIPFSYLNLFFLYMLHLFLVPVMSRRGVRATLRYCIFFVPVLAISFSYLNLFLVPRDVLLPCKCCTTILYFFCARDMIAILLHAVPFCVYMYLFFVLSPCVRRVCVRRLPGVGTTWART